MRSGGAVMYHNKVVICGVDTAKLPVLSEAEKEKIYHLNAEKLLNI